MELKAIIQLDEVHLAQAINYLEAFNLEVGLLINFGARSLQFKRVTNKNFKQENQGNPINHSSDSVTYLAPSPRHWVSYTFTKTITLY